MRTQIAREADRLRREGRCPAHLFVSRDDFAAHLADRLLPGTDPGETIWIAGMQVHVADTAENAWVKYMAARVWAVGSASISAHIDHMRDRRYFNLRAHMSLDGQSTRPVDFQLNMPNTLQNPHAPLRGAEASFAAWRDVIEHVVREYAPATGHFRRMSWHATPTVYASEITTQTGAQANWINSSRIVNAMHDVHNTYFRTMTPENVWVTTSINDFASWPVRPASIQALEAEAEEARREQQMIERIHREFQQSAANLHNAVQTSARGDPNPADPPRARPYYRPGRW